MKASELVIMYFESFLRSLPHSPTLRRTTLRPPPEIRGHTGYLTFATLRSAVLLDDASEAAIQAVEGEPSGLAQTEQDDKK